MRTTLLASTLLLGALTLGAPMGRAQEPQTPKSHLQSLSSDLAVTYTTERSNVTPGGGQFWLQGGSLDGAVTFLHGFGLALNASGDFSSNVAPHLGLVELSAMLGPRYTRRIGSKSKHESRLFGEALAGILRGSDSAFPKTTGFDTRAESFIYQVGGGWDISVTKHIAIRPVEADYVQSYLPNNGSNTQSHLRLAFGVVYHSGK
jgi:hypothetical protein